MFVMKVATCWSSFGTYRDRTDTSGSQWLAQIAFWELCWEVWHTNSTRHRWLSHARNMQLTREITRDLDARAFGDVFERASDGLWANT